MQGTGTGSCHGVALQSDAQRVGEIEPGLRPPKPYSTKSPIPLLSRALQPHKRYYFTADNVS